MRHSTRQLLPSLALAAACAACSTGEDAAWLSESDGLAVARSAGAAAAHELLLQRGNTDPADGFVERRVLVDEGGETPAAAHLHVRQTHGGVPVWGGEAIIHLRPDGSVKSVTDDLLPEVNRARRSVQPGLARSRAIALALEAAGLAEANLTAPAKADLWFFRHDDNDSLAWRVQLDRLDGSASTARPVVFLDAETGAVLHRYDNLQTGTGKSIYSGTVTVGTTLSGSTHQLKDAARGNNQTNNMNHATTGSGTLMTDADDVWGNGTNSDPASAAIDAHYGAAMTWDYYKNIHGRNGIINTGAGVPSRVHYGNAYVNAYWDGAQMTYGDGTANNDPLVSIDVAGHEMSHGVTENTAGLIYSGEAGGLNEATSDIFGTCVEFYANNASDVGDYLIGEMININGDGTPLRYMDKPSKDGASPDCWSSTVGNLDVHYSSGPANHFFYLLSEGSGAKTINGVAYNSPTCNGTSVPGITRAKAEKIWYRALSTYMTSSTNYAAARTATLNAATDLYGANSTEYVVTANTWAAINVGTVIGGTDGGTGGTDAGTGGTDAGTGGSDGGSDGGSGGSGVLQNNVPVNVPSTATGARVNYLMVVPAGSTNLSFATSGGTGDADLYVKFGSAPTTTSYDCRPYTSGNSETCSFATAQAGTYYVMVNAYSSFSGVSLVGRYTGSGGGSDGGPSDGGSSDGGTTDGGSGDGGSSDGGSSDGGTPPGSPLVNGGFEGSVSPWVQSGTGAYYTSTGSYPHSGSGYVYLGYNNSTSGNTYQQFTVPTTGTATLSFWLAVTSNETTATTVYDKLVVEVRSTSGALLQTLATYSNLNKTSSVSYAQKAFSLAAYKGQTIRLNFRQTTDSSLVTTFRIDDVVLN